MKANAQGENLIYRWFDASGNVIGNEQTLKVTHSAESKAAFTNNSTDALFYVLAINAKGIDGYADLKNLVSGTCSPLECGDHKSPSCKANCCAANCTCSTGDKCTCEASGVSCGCKNGTCKSGGGMACKRKGQCCENPKTSCTKACCAKACKCSSGAECTCEAQGVKCSCKDGNCKVGATGNDKNSRCCDKPSNSRGKGCCAEGCKCSNGEECSCKANGVTCGCKSCGAKSTSSCCKSTSTGSLTLEQVKKLVNHPSKSHAGKSVTINFK